MELKCLAALSSFKMVPILPLLLVALIDFKEVKGHGRLMEPPNRSSVWRFKEFASHNPPINYDDNELFCGGATELNIKNGGKCGPCGDDFKDPTPRNNENGGLYGRGIIVRKYSSGQKIKVAVELTRSHLGYFEFSLCSLQSAAAVETESCFAEKLALADGSGTKFPVSSMETGYFNTTVILPKRPCARCVFRWNYKTGNSWGDCGNGISALGCGPQEVFRGCADIMISA